MPKTNNISEAGDMMFGWMGSKKQETNSPSGAEIMQNFLVNYSRTDKKTHYALYMWGIMTAFNQIFGNLDGFQAAADELRKKYIVMLGTNAVRYAKEGNRVASECNSFYMNYLVATKGVARKNLRGSVEQIADMLDGIVRFGAAENARIKAGEEAAQEHARTETGYRIGSGVVKGPVTDRTVGEVAAIVLHDLRERLETGQDYYWFMIEQHDLLLADKSAIRTLLDDVPLFPIEYEGMRTEDSYVGKPNTGITYMDGIRPAIRHWCAATVPHLDAGELSTRVMATAYATFRKIEREGLDNLRLAYADHYRNNCLASGSYRNAEKWKAVIAALS